MTSTSSATVDNAAKLGSSTGSSIGNRSNGGQVLGKEFELGDLIHKFNAKECTWECMWKSIYEMITDVEQWFEQADSQSNKPNDHGDDQCTCQTTINIHH